MKQLGWILLKTNVIKSFVRGFRSKTIRVPPVASSNFNCSNQFHRLTPPSQQHQQQQQIMEEQQHQGTRTTIPAINSNLDSKPYLFWFSNEHSNFIDAEMESIFKLFNFDPQILEHKETYGPFVILHFPSEECVKLFLSRSVLTHSCFELWAAGNTLQELHDNFKLEMTKFTIPYQDTSFRLRIESYGNKLSQSTKLELIETFDYIPLDGPIDLSNPDCSLHLINYYGLDGNQTPELPYHLFFGRWIGDGQRNLINKISLKTRKFIGNTSMDPLLSLLMANVGCVKDGSIVLDPFVGTGSLLVASALMGGYVCGTDIDYLMLHGKTRPTRAYEKVRSRDESIAANMKQYEVESQYLDVLVADASRPLWRTELKFDAIITDPPYGIREPTEKIGTTKSNLKIKDEHIPGHIPSKVDYMLHDIFKDLVQFSSKKLVLGGRLVFWIPVARYNYEESKLPSHPSFKIVSNSEQALTTFAGRRLLVMEKIKEPQSHFHTIIDSSALMYRYKFFEQLGKTRKERKSNAESSFGKSTKRGQLIGVPVSSAL